MQTSSSTSRVKQPKSFLFIGPPGSGKTTAMLGFPRLWFADCDLNLEGPERYVREKLKSEAVWYHDPIAYDDNGVPVDPPKRWTRFLVKLAEAVRSPDIQTIGIDSLSNLNQFLIDWQLARSRRENMEVQDWIPFVGQMVQAFNIAKLSGKHLIVVAHELSDYDNKGVLTRHLPNLSSQKLRDSFPALFSDVLRFDRVPGSIVTGPKYKIFTVRTGLDEYLKNGYFMPSEIELRDGQSAFSVLNQYIKLKL